MADNQLLYAARYDDVNTALADLDAVEQLHDDELVGKYDGAVIDEENGQPHIVKRVDHPRINIIPEWFGGGPLPRKDLQDAAKQLGSGEAALIVVGEPTIEKGLEKAVTRADKVAKQSFDMTADELSGALVQALRQQ
jgi:hypothetical protein